MYSNTQPLKTIFQNIINRLPASWFNEEGTIIKVVVKSHKDNNEVCFTTKTYNVGCTGRILMNGMNVSHMIGFPKYDSMFIMIGDRQLEVGHATPFSIIEEDSRQNLKVLYTLVDKKYNFTAEFTGGVPEPLMSKKKLKLIDKAVDLMQEYEGDNMYDNLALKEVFIELQTKPGLEAHTIKSNATWLISQAYHVNFSNYVRSDTNVIYNKFFDVREGTAECHHMTLAQYLRILIAGE